MLLLLLAASAPAEELRLLSYNTHGLPGWVARDAPEQRLPAIAAELERYDLALLQEDFAYHDRLLSQLRATRVLRGNGRRSSCPICSGSGLTLVSTLPAGTLAEVTQQAYGRCAGWLGGANDCLATKGFQLARIELPSGARLHLAHTHLDAGRSAADRAVRRQQLALLAEAIRARVGAGALVVAGDLNLDAAQAEDAALLTDFLRALGLQDSGAHPPEGSHWKVLDYLLVRSGPDAQLSVHEAGEDTRFQLDGAPLSDHPAIFVKLAVEPVRSSRALSEWSRSPRPRESPRR